MHYEKGLTRTFPIASLMTNHTAPTISPTIETVDPLVEKLLKNNAMLDVTNEGVIMTISLATVGLFCLGIYLLQLGLVGLFGMKIPAKVGTVFAFIAGVCILFGLFVTQTLVLQ